MMEQKGLDAKHKDCMNSDFQIFSSIDRRLTETGSFAISNRNAGHSRNARTSEMEERVLTTFKAASSIGTRAVAYELGISQ